MTMQVFGRVLVDETGSPIRDVLVSVFDVDPQQASPVDESPVVEAMQPIALPESSDALGTAITDERGAFNLEYEVSDFADEPRERRPDLVVAAFAPAQAREKGGVMASSRVERLLLEVRAPRPRAGRTEGFVLRIAEKHVLRHGLDVVEQREVQGAPSPLRESFASVLRRGQGSDVEARRAVAEAVRSGVRQGLERRQLARAKAAEFSSLSRDFRAHELVVGGNGSAVDRQERTEKALTAARTSGTTRLADQTFSEVPLAVHHEDLVRVLPDGADPFNGPWQISMGGVCDLLHTATTGHRLVRTRSVLDALRANHDPRPEPPPTEGHTDPEEEDADEPPAVAEWLRTRVEHLVADISPGVDHDGLLPDQADLARLQSDLRDAELQPGPADTTAYHDFHSLQLALPDVWVEALNPDLRRGIEWLYDQFVQLHEDYTGEELPPDAVSITERAEVQELLHQLEVETDLVDEQVGRTLPPDLHLLWPAATYLWALTPPRVQEALAAIATAPVVYTNTGERVSEPLGTAIHFIAYRDDIRREVSARREAVDQLVADVDFAADPTQTLDKNAPAPEARTTRIRRLLDEVGRMLTEKWAFEYFAENSSNLGIMVTYRQTWQPGPYQVGDLVTTVPLAPGEQRTYEISETVQRTRAQKEVERSVSTRAGESTRSLRASDEIIRRAEEATNFQLTAEGSINFGLGSIGSTTQFARSQQLHSQDTTTTFREAVVKASHEYTNDRTLEVAVNTDSTRVSKTSGQLSNPNNELTVTYLLYELQRQYRVSESIHSVTPVILVAQPMPGPGDITEAWLLEHEWILKRVLLDTSLLPALTSLTDGAVADEVSLEVKRAAWKGQLRIVQRLEGELDRWTARKRELQDVLIGARQREAMARSMEENQGWLGDLVENLVAYDFGDAAVDNMAAKVKAVEERLTNVQAEIDRAAEQVGNAKEAFQVATREFTTALEERTQQRVNVDQLRIHVKQNILHYMQAIWGHEPPDQRYFRLYMKKVFVPADGTATCTVRPARPDERGERIPGLPGGTDVVIESCSPPRLVGLSPDQFQECYKVADLDHPMGFKGNYMIFPLKTCSMITDFMIREYVDSYFGVRDPDAFADYTTDQLIAARRELLLDDEEGEAIDDLIAARLASGRRETDTIVVPTGQMYIEALLGSHTLLEKFKLAHRGYDALQAREQLRRTGLENLRYAARLVADEPVLGDPEVDRQVLVQGAEGVVVNDG